MMKKPLFSFAVGALVVGLAGTAAAGDKGDKKVVDKKHQQGPVKSIRDVWQPDSLVLQVKDPGHPHVVTATVTVDRDGSWLYSGKIEGEPCFPNDIFNGGKCNVAITMGLKSAKGTWFYFQDEAKGVGKAGHVWTKQGRSKVLADNFDDFAAKGHEWTGSIAIHFKPKESHDDGGFDLGGLAKDVGSVLGVVGTALAFF